MEGFYIFSLKSTKNTIKMEFLLLPIENGFQITISEAKKPDKVIFGFNLSHVCISLYQVYKVPLFMDICMN